MNYPRRIIFDKNLKGNRDKPRNSDIKRTDVLQKLVSIQITDPFHNKLPNGKLKPSLNQSIIYMGGKELSKDILPIGIELEVAPGEPELILDPTNWPFLPDKVPALSEMQLASYKAVQEMEKIEELKKQGYEKWLHYELVEQQAEWSRCFINKISPPYLPNLFHKYLLGLSRPLQEIKYRVVQEPKVKETKVKEPKVKETKVKVIEQKSKPNTKVILSKVKQPQTQNTKDEKDEKNKICVIHCYDLNKFVEFFQDALSITENHFDILVCFCIDYPEIRYINNSYTFLQVPNYGMDIGSRFSAINYLTKKGYQYTYYFFIHSKKVDYTRNEYLSPFLKNMKNILSELDKPNHIGGIFHDIIHSGSNYVCFANRSIHKNKPKFSDEMKSWGKNSIYMEDIAKYMNLPDNYLFSEGNFYILHKDIVNEMFTDKNLYNLLNSPNSFDYHWVNTYYSLNETYSNVHKQYIENGYYGNNLQTGLGHAGLADCMIEHIFERIVFSVILKHQMQIKIVSNLKNKVCINVFMDLMNSEIVQDSKQLLVNYYQHPEVIKNLNTTKNICIIACHTYNMDKINIVLNHIDVFQEFANDIVIVDSLEFESNELYSKIRLTFPNACINDEMTSDQLIQYKLMNPDLCILKDDTEVQMHYYNHGRFENRRGFPFTHNIYIQYIKNDKYACFSKYLHYLKKMEMSIYNKIILTNDSYVIVNSLNSFFELAVQDVDMTGIISSNETRYHYPDFLRCYNKNSIHTLIEFYDKNRHRIKCFDDLIRVYEIPSTYLFKNRNVLYEVDQDYKKNIHFDNEVLPYYLKDIQYPIIKYKKLIPTVYTSKKLPKDFDPNVYQTMNGDLSHLSTDQLESHFIDFGISEGRLYKPNQKRKFPDYIKPHLPDWLQKKTQN